MTLYRFRNQVIVLDSATCLTRGNPAGLAAWSSHLLPTRGVYTAVVPSTDGRPPLIGQVTYQMGERSARLAFMLPESEASAAAAGDLLNGLAVQAGSWGAYNLLAEIDEHHAAFEGLRRAGFFVYAWQQVWRMQPVTGGQNGCESRWKPATALDELAVRSLFLSLVPPLVQSAEPLSAGSLHGLVYHQEGEVLGYAEIVSGPGGIYIQPLLHPAVDDVPGLLCDLMRTLGPLLKRPVYLAVRSYQAWLEATLQQMQAEMAPRQALMVKHLTTTQRVPILSPRLSVLEKRQTEPSAPMARVEKHR